MIKAELIRILILKKENDRLIHARMRKISRETQTHEKPQKSSS